MSKIQAKSQLHSSSSKPRFAVLPAWPGTKDDDGDTGGGGRGVDEC
jgi:hypothetical protein